MKIIQSTICNTPSLNFCFWIGFVFTLFLNTSCTRPQIEHTPEERARGVDDFFAPGTADGIYSVEKFRVIDLPSSQLDESVLSNEALKIKTSKTGEKAKVSISTGGAFVDPESNISFVNQYYFLQYKPIEVKTEAQKLLVDLLGKVEKFKGFPDTVYHIIPHLQNNYLILYRLSDPKKLPYDELPISIKVGDKLATPLVGYPIDYCVAEKILNPNLEETGQNRPKCIGVSQKSAKYIHLVDDRKNVFDYLPKVDIFPKNFFDGQWFFVKTIIKSSGDQSTGLHQSFRSANLVELEKHPESLNVLDASGYKIEEKDKLTGFSIPVEWKEYEIERDSDIIHQFGERESETGADITRDYFKIDFEALVKNEVSVSSTTVAETDSVFITDDYFSFIIKISGKSNRWVKYAFKKAVKNPNYVEKRWFETDSSQFFPAFSVSRKYYDRKASIHTEEGKKKFERVTRFDPTSPDDSVTVKKIVWYFSKQTPKDEWVRKFGRLAVEYWNAAFQKAGEGSNYQIQIVLDESTDRELGDIRYNIINLIQSPQSDAFLLGYGPNIANPITGEILSATANVWVTNIVDQYILLLRKYIRFHIYPPVWKPLPESPGVTDFMHEKIKKLCASRDDSRPNVPSVMEFINQKQEEKKGKAFHHPTASSLGDNEIIEVCARKIAVVDVLNTTLHEMGHGFGYRHVFSASADKDNFYKDYDEVKEIFGKNVMVEVGHDHAPAKFSSLMDYGRSQYPGLTVPGKYDIAATKFLYFDKVDLVNGGTLDVPAGADSNPEAPQKDIISIAEEKGFSIGEEDTSNGKKVKQYRVCGGKALDKSASDIHPDDPLCTQWDYGATPLEVVQNAIRLTWDNIMTNRNRYDSRSHQPRVPGGTMALRYVSNMYNKWLWYRNQLLQSRQMNLADFSFLDTDDIKEYKGLITKEAERNKEFKLYYEAVQPIFDFYKKIFFLPVKHCVYEKDGEYQAVALEVIKKRIYNEYPDNSRELFVNCQSPAAEKWADENNKGVFITEVGYLGRHTEYFLKAKQEDMYDELSIFMFPLDTQGLSVSEALHRKGKSPVGTWEGLVSTMHVLLYEPHFGNEIVEEQIDYLLKGMDLNPYISDADKKEKLNNEDLPRFLSYEIDSNILQHRALELDKPVSPIDLLSRRNVFLEQLIQAESNKTMSGDKIDMIKRKFNVYVFSANQQTVDMFTNPQQYSITHPAILELYEEHKQYSNQNDGEPKALVNYILDHPAVCVDQSKLNIRMPHTISEENHRANLCRRLHEYNECINKHSAEKACEDIEDKKAYINFVYRLLRLN